MSKILNMRDRFTKKEHKPLEYIVDKQETDNPLWFLSTPLETTIGVKEKKAIHDIINNAIPLQLLVSIANADKNVTIVELLKEIGIELK
jgi:hypothetical protein